MTLFKQYGVALLSLIVLLTGNHLKAQDLDESNFIRYTRLQGLSNNYVSGIVQDSSGFIWIATHKGLNRFDGKSFQALFKGSPHSPLPDNLMVSMHPQNSDEIMGATRGGAFSYNSSSGVYNQFIVPCDSSIYFWANHVNDIVKNKKGNYIVSTRTGLYVFNSSGQLILRYDHHLPPDVGKIEFLFGGWLQNLADGSTLQQNSLFGSIYNASVNRIDTFYVAKKQYLKKAITDPSGNMRTTWPGNNWDLFILNIDKNAIEVTNMNLQKGNSSPMPFSVSAELGWRSSLTFINDSTLVITCKNSGFYLLHYNPETMTLTCDGKKYFERSVCTTIFKDRESRLWIGTADGLYKQNLHSSFFSVTDLSLDFPYLLNHEIRSIFMEDSSLFLGLQNEGGLLILDKKSRHIKNKIQFTPLDQYSNTVVNIFPYNKDTLWIGTAHGILWLNKKNYHYGRLHIPQSLSWAQEFNSNCFFEDSKKNIWISFGKLNGLIRYSRESRTFSEISPADNPLLRITFVFSIAEDLQGNIWLAGDGICRWNVKTQHVDTLIPYPRVSKLLRNYMFILDRDAQNNLWLSSFDNEIIEFNCTTKSMFLRQEENNLIDGNTITNSPIIENNIWMGTDNGISAFNIDHYTVKQFTYADGLPSVAITTLKKGSFYDKQSNRFYIGARHRLISFVPDASALHKKTPSLFIEKVSIHDSLISPVPREIRLTYNQNDVTIDFNTINYTDPEENRFAWRSLGSLDTSWNQINDQSSITLTNLSGGWHSIQVKLFSVNNHWPQQVRTLNVYIRPPFWLMGWFIMLVAVFVMSTIFLIYKTRVNSVRKHEREKAQAQELIAEEYKNRFELEQIINYFSSSLKEKNSVDEVLWDVMQNLISRLGYVDCIIYLWNDDRTRMIQKAAYGPKGSPDVIALSAFDVVPGQGLVGHVMQTMQPIVVGDTSRDKRYRVDDMRRLSEITVPIIHDDELLGIIDSEHHLPDFFKERDLKILTTVATLVANKIKQIQSEQSLEINRKEIALINQQLAEAQLSALQTQMNPHFIFNCLNSIKGMILSDEQLKASRYLSKFADMIRTTLNQSREIFTTLYENLEHLETYLVMEKLRFDDSFTFRIIADPDIDREETLIPTLMIQPLAENAIWHGLMNKRGKKKLTIHFSKVGHTICCRIEDNGIGINRAEQIKRKCNTTHQSVGLSNLRNRIKIMNEKYDLGCTLTLSDLKEENHNKTGTCAFLRFNMITNKIYI